MTLANILHVGDADRAASALRAVADRLELRGGDSISAALRRAATALEQGGVIHIVHQSGRA